MKSRHHWGKEGPGQNLGNLPPAMEGWLRAYVPLGGSPSVGEKAHHLLTIGKRSYRISGESTKYFNSLLFSRYLKTQYQILYLSPFPLPLFLETSLF